MVGRRSASCLGCASLCIRSSQIVVPVGVTELRLSSETLLRDRSRKVIREIRSTREVGERISSGVIT